jgi:hypothetical protein
MPVRIEYSVVKMVSRGSLGELADEGEVDAAGRHHQRPIEMGGAA